MGNVSDNIIIFLFVTMMTVEWKCYIVTGMLLIVIVGHFFLGGPDIYKNVPNYHEKVTVDHFRGFQILEHRASEVGNKRKWSGILNV